MSLVDGAEIRIGRFCGAKEVKMSKIWDRPHCLFDPIAFFSFRSTAGPAPEVVRLGDLNAR